MAEPDTVKWWHHPINLLSIALALVIGSAAIGWVVGNNTAIPDPNSTDIGFLQDMRAHHEQAQQMAMIYLNADDADPQLRTVARSILIGQGIDIGRMVELLNGFGAAQLNETDTAMVWMGEPTALDRMPGMATEADIDQLVEANGAEADRIFATLMIAHHEGGIHMADYAVDHANVGAVRALAQQMLDGQQSEVDEINGLLAS